MADTILVPNPASFTKVPYNACCSPEREKVTAIQAAATRGERGHLITSGYSVREVLQLHEAKQFARIPAHNGPAFAPPREAYRDPHAQCLLPFGFKYPEAETWRC